jgi:hypothetical protein
MHPGLIDLLIVCRAMQHVVSPTPTIAVAGAERLLGFPEPGLASELHAVPGAEDRDGDATAAMGGSPDLFDAGRAARLRQALYRSIWSRSWSVIRP